MDAAADRDLLDFTTEFPQCLWEQRKVSRRNDLTLRVGKECGPVEDFKANSDIIMARCKYMRTVVPVKDSLTELHKVINIPDTTPDQFTPYFEYIHTDNMECFKSVDDLVNGLYAGKRFDTPPLVTKCREKLIKLIKKDPVENGLTFIKRTEDFIHEDEESELMQKFDSLFYGNISNVLKNEKLKPLNYETMKRVIGNNNCGAEPLQRLVALNRWAEERLRNKNVVINQKSKMDLCSEVLLTIPVQDIPLSDFHLKVRDLQLLSDELMFDVTKYHYDYSVNLPFPRNQNVEFNSVIDNDSHQHNSGEFRRRLRFSWEVGMNTYRSSEIGFEAKSDEFSCEEEPGTKWVVSYYPRGRNKEDTTSFGMYLRSCSIDEQLQSIEVAHYKFEIMANNHTLISRELSFLYTDTRKRFGNSSIINLLSLPDKFTLVVYVQWSPVPQMFYQPSKMVNIDGKQMCRVEATWNVRDCSSGNCSAICSPVFGRDGYCWTLRRNGNPSSLTVQLTKLPQNLGSIVAKVTLTVIYDNVILKHIGDEEKTYKINNTSKDFALGKNHQHVVIHAAIEYEI